MKKAKVSRLYYHLEIKCMSYSTKKFIIKNRPLWQSEL